jgi:hypothetical protein
VTGVYALRGFCYTPTPAGYTVRRRGERVSSGAGVARGAWARGVRAGEGRGACADIGGRAAEWVPEQRRQRRVSNPDYKTIFTAVFQVASTSLRMKFTTLG